MDINEILDQTIRQIDDMTVKVYKCESLYPSRAGALEGALYFALTMLTPAQLAVWAEVQNKSYHRQLESV